MQHLVHQLPRRGPDKKQTNLTDSEDVEEFLDVVVILDSSGKFFPSQGGGEAGRHQLGNFLNIKRIREKVEKGRI